jgi:hypothetical protein
MARGKITEYEQGGFSRQAVGTPGMDQSGAIIGEGIASLGDALIKRQEASDNLTAMDKFGEFEFQNAQKKFDLQRKYQNDPEKYVTAAREESMKLADEFSKGMSGGASRKFRELSTRSIAQDMESNARWAFARDNEIQVGKIDSTTSDIVIKAAMAASPEDLLSIKADFAAVRPDAEKFITSESYDKIEKDKWAAAKKMSMSAQMMNSPNKLKADLVNHAYDGILDADEIKMYSDQAQNAINNRELADLYRTSHLAEGKIYDFMQKLDDGSMNIVDLIAERESVYNNLGKAKSPEAKATSLAYLGAVDALIATKTLRVQKTPEGKAKKEEALRVFDQGWDKYLIEKATGRIRPSADDLTQELKLLEGLLTAYNNGYIDRNDLYDRMSVMSTKYERSRSDIGKAMPFEKAINEAGAITGFYGFRKGTDVISVGYRKIKEQIDREYPELLPEERTMMKAQALIQFNQMVKDTPKDQLDAQTTGEQRDQFVRRALLGGVNSAGDPVKGLLQRMAVTKDLATGKTYKVGDIIKDQYGNEKFFSGKQSDGTAIWKYFPGTTIKGSDGASYKVEPDGLHAKKL